MTLILQRINADSKCPCGLLIAGEKTPSLASVVTDCVASYKPAVVRQLLSNVESTMCPLATNIMLPRSPLINSSLSGQPATND